MLIESRHDSLYDAWHGSLIDSRHDSLYDAQHGSLIESRHDKHKLAWQSFTIRFYQEKAPGYPLHRLP